MTFLLEASSFGRNTYIKGKWGSFQLDQPISVTLFPVTQNSGS